VTSARLSARDLSVSFNRRRVLDSIDLDIGSGRIVGLLGANGSGKSTTVKALTGVYPVESSSLISVNGAPIRGAAYGPNVARARGIRVVHQEAPLIADLTVAEAIGMHIGFPTTRGLIRQRELGRRTSEVLSAFDIDIDPRRLCGTLTAAERAEVSLALALSDVDNDSAILILDEATASLSTDEASRFLRRVREFADDGLSVLMVTHRLPEVREHCDDVVVLRDGIVAETFDRASFDELAVVRAMVGSDPLASGGVAERTLGTTHRRAVLSALDVSGPGIHNASFTVHEGEILGVTGRPGGGASELLRVLGGIEPPHSGGVTVDDHYIDLRGPRDAILAGMFYLSSDRLSEGGIPMMSVAENLVLPRTERYGWLRRGESSDIDTMVSTLDVRPADPSTQFGTLSGGNQQKVLLARWLLLKPRLLLLDDPTAGVDPNTRELLFRTLLQLAEEGVSVLLRSTEPEQLSRVCRRVLVLREGRIVDTLEGSHVTTEEISLVTYA
jgi:ABC-type sugar transport system ATPase subunit